MPDEKDHLGEQLRNKKQADEDRYFAEQSKRQLEKLRETHAKAAEAGQAACPRCGTALEVQQMKGVAIDTCPKGHGLWLDAGELEQITKREGDSWLSKLLLGRR